jgi:hypothetical protein
LLSEAGLGAVMRQHLGLGLDDVGKLCLQRLRDALMVLLAGAPQQRLIGGLLD